MEEQARYAETGNSAARTAEDETVMASKAARTDIEPDHYLEMAEMPERDFLYDEAVKTLRTNIQFSGSHIKIIMFTSCIPNEGKSSVSFDTARSLASIGKSVLYVDADLRKSVFVKRRNIRNRISGLSKYLSGQDPLDEIYYSTNIENLDVVLAGPFAPNPAELLEDQLFEEFIAESRKRYDYVIIDTPPMANIIDGAIIARFSDGAIIVIKSGAVSYRGDQRVREQLDKSGCRIIGAVLNQVEVDKNSRGGYYYNHYYYNSYYGPKGSKTKGKTRKKKQ